MSYKALYRTYRPQTFDEVAGQKQIIQTLKNAIRDDKIAHAYLFTGPRGTGKTTMAKLLAKALNCESEGNKPCDQCEACLAISEGSFPDVIEIDAASNNGVDEVRNLIDKVKYAPIEGKYKVYIIDEVHMMSQGAFNALLKTLEEPPAHVIFILATTEPHKVLPTILSRCQRFDFGRISKQDIEKRIQVVLEKENIVYDDGVIELVSELCDGGMRDALSILDQTIAYAGEVITPEDIRNIYGIVSNEEKVEFLDYIVNNNHQALLEKISEYDERGIDISRLTNNLIDLLKEIIIYKSANSLSGLKVINETNKEKFANVKNKKLFSMIDVLVEALSSYRKAGSPKALFEIACLKMCGLNDVVEETVVYKEVLKPQGEEVKPVQVDTKEESVKMTPTFSASEEKIVAPFISEPTIEKKVEEVIEKETIKVDSVESKEDVVSHETEEVSTVEEQNSVPTTTANNYIPSEEELLNVLVQASKDALLKAKQQWVVMLPRYLNSATTAKVTGILLDGVPVAACDNCIIIGYNNDVYLNRIYAQGNYEEMNSFLKALYNNDMKCYCLTIQEFTALKEKYMTLRQLGKLPKPVPIVIQKRNIETNTQSEPVVDEGIEYAKKLFGDNVIIKEGE